MSKSITDSEACASEFDETWIPPQGSIEIIPYQIKVRNSQVKFVKQNHYCYWNIYYVMLTMFLEFLILFLLCFC